MIENDEVPADQTHAELEERLQYELAHFQFPKMHAAGHFHDVGYEIGSLLQTSTEFGEPPHTRVKRAYKNTNKIKPELQMVNRLGFEHAMATRIANLTHAALALGPENCPYELQDRLKLYDTNDKRKATICRQQGGEPVVQIPRPPLKTEKVPVMRTTLIGDQKRNDKVDIFSKLNEVYESKLGYRPAQNDDSAVLGMIKDYYVREGRPLSDQQQAMIADGPAGTFTSVMHIQPRNPRSLTDVSIGIRPRSRLPGRRRHQAPCCRR